MSLIIHTFLIYPTSKGTKNVSLLTHKSYLGTSSTTLERRELQALNLAAEICLKIVLELSVLLSGFRVMSASKVNIFWVLHKENKQLEIRVDNISNKLNQAMESLHEENVSEGHNPSSQT